MYTDFAQWTRVRDLVLLEGKTRVAVSALENVGISTIRKMLTYEKPPGYRYKEKLQNGRRPVHNDIVDKQITDNHRLPEASRLSTTELFQQMKCSGFTGSLSSVFYHRRLHEDADEGHLGKTVQRIVRMLPDEDGADFISSLFSRGTLAGNSHAAGERRRKIHNKSTALAKPLMSSEFGARAGWDQWLSDLEETGEYKSKIFSEADTRYLLNKLSPKKNIDRKKALLLLALDQDLPTKYLIKFLGISLRAAYSCFEANKLHGVEGPFFTRPRLKKENNHALKKMVFSLLHEPPSLSGINRTSWRMDDLKKILKEKGFPASYEVLRTIIKDSGFKWKCARKVLTSHDPNYKIKLAHVQDILGHLKDNERFFSIDEFGPFSVKTQMGCSLSPPKEPRIVPQFQRSKGMLICTAALELSRNQITHFFSPNKNSAEMIKLAIALIEKYPATHKLYLSWDAASWHKANSLLNFVEEHNAAALSTHLPFIEIVPLPASAQFLNIIESVFSGMSKAIIHNSDYATKEDAMRAIDLYFSERNQHYLAHPKAAGKKLWGLERTSTEFSPENNCKDPSYR
jgi:transposase